MTPAFFHAKIKKRFIQVPLQHYLYMKTALKIVFVIATLLGILYSRPFFLQFIPSSELSFPPPESSPPPKEVEKTPPEATSSFIQEKPFFQPENMTLSLPVYTWPPYSMLDETGKWTGADVEIVEAVLSRMGYLVKWVEMPFTRALEEMKNGSFPAMAPCVTGGGREEFMYFSAPVSSIYTVLWKKRDNPFTWESYDDLNGKIIGASYYHYGAGFMEAARDGKFTLDMVAAKAPEIIHFQKLLDGKTDLFICELSVGLYLKHKYKPDFDEVDYIPKGIGPRRPFCLPASRKYFVKSAPEMFSFINSFNRELAVFSLEGGREQIFNNYHMSIRVDGNGMITLPGER